MDLRNIFTGRSFSFETQESLNRFSVFLTKQLPEHIRDEGQKLVDKAFRQERYPDGKSSKWAPRKRDLEAAEERVNRRALLVKTGKLVASTTAEIRGLDIVAIMVNDPIASKYAQVHNEGLQSGRGRGFKMPQRQFMPIPGQSSPELDRAVEKFIDRELDKILK